MVVKVEAYADATMRENDEKLDYFDIRVVISGAAKDVVKKYADKFGIENKTELLQNLIYRGIMDIAAKVGF